MKAFLLALALIGLALPAAADAPGPIIGIGTELESDHGAAVVAQVIPGSPADRAGVRAGDRIVAVDQKNVESMPVAQVAHLLHGPRDSAVRITVNRGGGRKEFTLKREILFLSGPQPNH